MAGVRRGLSVWLVLAAALLPACLARSEDAVGATDAAAAAESSAASLETAVKKVLMPLAYTAMHGPSSTGITKSKKGAFKNYVAASALKGPADPMVYLGGGAHLSAASLKKIADANAASADDAAPTEEGDAEAASEKAAEEAEKKERAEAAKAGLKRAKDGLRAIMSSGDMSKFWAAKGKLAEANIALVDAIPGAQSKASEDDEAAEAAMRNKLLAAVKARMLAAAAAESDADDEPASDWKAKLTRTVGRVTFNISSSWLVENRKSFEDAVSTDIARSLGVSSDDVDDIHLKGKTVEFIVAESDIAELMNGKTTTDFAFDDVTEAVGIANTTVNASLVSYGLQWCHGNGKFINATKSCRCNMGFAADDCSIDSCNNHGSWDFSKNKCECDNGYLVSSNCKKHACAQHGIYKSGVCSCNYWWIGSDCSKPKPEPTCMGRGTYNRTTLKCQCKKGSWPSFDMQRCEKVDPKAHPLCNKRGSLISNDTACNCTKVGWTGERCGIPPCSGHGVFYKGKACICDAGHGGKVCDKDYCNGHGKLIEPLDAKKGCICKKGYSGPKEKQCSVHACHERGTLLKDSTCDCRPGFTPASNCSTALCLNGNWEGGAAGGCVCDPGFKGKTCEVDVVAVATGAAPADPSREGAPVAPPAAVADPDAASDVATAVPLTEAEEEKAEEQSKLVANQQLQM